MITLTQLSQVLQTLLNNFAETAARQSGLVQRSSKLSGAKFVQTLVFGWLKNPRASLGELTQTAASLEVDISPQGLDQRFGPKAADCLKLVLEEAVQTMVAAEPVAVPLLARFNGVYLQDSSIVALPDALSEVWAGCGGSNGESAALKLSVRLEVCSGTMTGPELSPGREQDRSCAIQHELLPAGAMRVADLGYFSLKVFEELDEAGAYWLSRVRVGTVVLDEQEQEWELGAFLRAQGTDKVDVPIRLSREHKLPCRLLAERVPPQVAEQRRRRLRQEGRRKGRTPSKARLALADWTVYVTNAPVELVSLEEALVLGRVRWQVEMVFKLWKSQGQIDEWRSAKPWRILCEVYAKLLGMVIEHWVMLTGSWKYPDRSLLKAAQTVQSYAAMMAVAMVGVIDMEVVLEQIRRCLEAGCRIQRRRKHPAAFQLLLGEADVS
jgi:hypothetical protein